MDQDWRGIAEGNGATCDRLLVRFRRTGWSVRSAWNREFDFVGGQRIAGGCRVNHHAIADGQVGKFGSFAVARNVHGPGHQFHFHRFPVGLLYDHRIGVDFFQRAHDVLFVAVSERAVRKECEECQQRYDLPLPVHKISVTDRFGEAATPTSDDARPPAFVAPVRLAENPVLPGPLRDRADPWDFRVPFPHALPWPAAANAG